MPKVAIVVDPAPNAFATGRNPEHALIAFTTGILDAMDRDKFGCFPNSSNAIIPFAAVVTTSNPSHLLIIPFTKLRMRIASSTTITV
jgi:hypothetical protein